jgi:hypothetical protein
LTTPLRADGLRILMRRRRRMVTRMRQPVDGGDGDMLAIVLTVFLLL